jgi:hypothetical protein
MHCLSQETRKAPQSQPWSMLQSMLGIAASVMAFSFFWLLGSAVMQRYTGSGVGNGISGVSTSVSAGSAYAPKEYSKDTIPEKSVKTFKDVKVRRARRACADALHSLIRDVSCSPRAQSLPLPPPPLPRS